MTDKTVKELALTVGRPVDKILEQIKDAGLPQRHAGDLISTREQDLLIHYLKGKQAVNRYQDRITIKKRINTTTTTIPRVAKQQPKTINVEVRKKHTFVKPDPELIKLEALKKIKINSINNFNNFIKNHIPNIDIEEVNKRIFFNANSSITRIDLSGLNLTSLDYLDSVDLENIIEINLDNNDIKILKINNKMQNIKNISINNNPLEIININSEISSFDILRGYDTEKIRSLELNNNRLTQFVIRNNFKNLMSIKLYGNLTEIDEVSIDTYFKEISWMNFSNSKINKFSIIKNLPESFLSLDIGNNNINFLKLPYKIFEKNSRNSYIEVNLENNNLPDLILSALKKESVIERHRELRDIFFDVITVNRVKLIFLGNTGVGKTTLYKVLKSEDRDYYDYDGNSTEGVNIFSYNFKHENKNIEVKGFDFGGQDYYHNTHYSFFSSNALYILLWGNNQYIYHRSYYNRNNSKNESKIEITYPLNYWLGSVSYFINKEKNTIESKIHNKENIRKENLKLHLIQNPHHSDIEINSCEYELDRVTLKNRYPFISGFYTFPSLTNKHFHEYKDSIKNNIENIIKNYSTQETYPKILAQIEKKLRIKSKKNREFIISIDAIQEIFFEENKNIGWDGNFIQILEWLDITMSIYWISEEKVSNFIKNSNLSSEILSILSRYAVLDLSKLNEIIHNILISNLNNGDLKGIYKKSEIYGLLSNFKNKEITDYVSAFMLYNKIYFEAPNSLDNDKIYIAPNYLNEDTTLAEKLFLESFDIPFIEYRFEDFYHVNIFTEVLVQYKRNLSSTAISKEIDYLLWKNKAVLFENTNSSFSEQVSRKQPLVFLEFDLGEILDQGYEKPLDDITDLRKPSIRISTYSKNRKPISEIFLKDIISFIDNQLIGYKYKKFALAPNQIDYVDVDNINNFLNNFDGNPTGLFTYENKIYRSADFSLFTNRKSAMKKIFISHSTDDYQEVQEFITHLQPLKREGLIDHWHCSQLIPNDIWDAEIQKNLWDSDIICMLISPSWLANEYIFSKELMVAIERKELFRSSFQGKDIYIFPIIIKPCIWERIGVLSQFQAAPQKAMPLNNYADKNQAWCDVLKKLYEILNKMDDPDFKPEIGGRLGKLYIQQYEGKLSKYN